LPKEEVGWNDNFVYGHIHLQSYFFEVQSQHVKEVYRRGLLDIIYWLPI
jgi:hypothetical protein